MSELKSSDYEAGWRLRIEGVTRDGHKWASEGVVAVDDEGDHYICLGTAYLENRHIPNHREREGITDITILDRPSPFEMGTRVVHAPTGREGVVDAFHLRRDGFPLGAVNIECGDGVWLAAAPDAFTLAPAPEPPTVDLWSWWTDQFRDRVCIVGVESDHVRYRDAGMVGENYGVENLAVVRLKWTRLPGPPEPKPGDVYVIGDSAWQNYGGGHFETGMTRECTWPAVIGRHTPEQMASLRVLANIGGAA